MRCKHEDRHQIFAMSRARLDLGYGDGNLSLLAVRSARIVNGLFEREVFALHEDVATTVWA